jgi:diguanylate cyclase (GGDEF)-like protein
MGHMNILRIFLRTLFSLLYTLLIGVFVIRIFSPGTPDTVTFFKIYQQVRQPIEMVVTWVISPVSWLTGLIRMMIPTAYQVWFPISPAAALVHHIVDGVTVLPFVRGTGAAAFLGRVNPELLFPGVFDWRLLLTTPILGLLETVMLDFLGHWQNIARRHQREARDRAIMREYQTAHPVQSMTSEVASNALNPLFQQMIRQLKPEIGVFSQPHHLDGLTHLLKRESFLERVGEEMGKALHRGGELSVLVLDIDDLGRINAQFGRAAGDDVLAQAAMALSQVALPSGKTFTSRYGAEELALLLTEANEEQATRIAEALREQVLLIRLPQAPKLRVSASVGVYTVRFSPTNGSSELTPPSLVAKADAQMYKAKRMGKNCVMAETLL